MKSSLRPWLGVVDREPLSFTDSLTPTSLPAFDRDQRGANPVDHSSGMKNAATRSRPRRWPRPGGLSATVNDVHALAIAKTTGAKGCRRAVGWQIARLLSRVLFAGSFAVFAGRLIEQGAIDATALAGALVGLAVLSGTGFIAEWQVADAEADVADQLRAVFRKSLSRMSPIRIRTRATGALVASLQRHPPALASLVVSHDAAKSMLGIGPLLVAAAIAVLSWRAALALLSTIPVMIVLFVLIGRAIRGRAANRENAFGRLAAQFADRIRTLPTILANHAVQNEHGKIQERTMIYADSTMSVLRLAFLNSAIIDFFSALTIAVLAVLFGLGRLKLLDLPGFHDLALWQTLAILVLSAEFFAPFRRYAEQYHIKAEGQAAATELDWFFEESNVTDSSQDASRSRPLGSDMTDLPPSGLIAVSGPSGSGKSTLLRMLAGLETPSSRPASMPRLADDGCDWVSTDIYVPQGTLADAIGWNRRIVDRAVLHTAAARVGLLDERLLPGGLDARIAEGGSNLSGGQRMRIGIARVLLSNRTVVADEPTAKLDRRTADLVRRTLIEIAAQRLVIVATHDPRLIGSAFRHHVLHPPVETRKAHAA